MSNFEELKDKVVRWAFERESLNEFGEVAGIVRISDKYRRLVNLTKNENKVLESKADTLKDMANYCLMLAV